MFRIIKKIIDSRREEDRQIEMQMEYEYQQRLRKRQCEERQSKARRLLESKLPIAYLLKFDCYNYHTTENGVSFTYARTDYFMCDQPVSDIIQPYSQYTLVKLTGKNIGNEYIMNPNGDLGNVALTDEDGNKYEGIIQRVGQNVKDNAETIKDLNLYNERVFNRGFKKMENKHPKF